MANVIKNCAQPPLSATQVDHTKFQWHYILPQSSTQFQRMICVVIIGGVYVITLCLTHHHNYHL